jgi:hypothetical protein
MTAAFQRKVCLFSGWGAEVKEMLANSLLSLIMHTAVSVMKRRGCRGGHKD